MMMVEIGQIMVTVIDGRRLDGRGGSHSGVHVPVDQTKIRSCKRYENTRKIRTVFKKKCSLYLIIVHIMYTRKKKFALREKLKFDVLIYFFS